MATDLASFDILPLSEKGVAMPLRHPFTGVALRDEDSEEKTPWTVTLLGRHSTAFAAAIKTINEVRATDQKTFAAQYPGMPIPPVPQERIDRENTDLLCACTREWTITVLDGKPFHCSPENMRTFWIGKRWPFFRQQGLDFMLGDANFLPSVFGTSKNSPDISSLSDDPSRPAEHSTISS
jgi:hypothetical protein